MNTIKLEARNTALSPKQLRRTGVVPCVVYGGGLRESVSGQLDRETARKLLRTQRLGSQVRLMLDGQLISAQIKDRDIDALSEEIRHVSFEALAADQKVNSVAHILLANVDKVTGVLEKLRGEVPYASLPADMIDTVTIDLEGLPVGTALTLGDIPEFRSEQIELQADTDSLVLRINDKRRALRPDEQ